MAIIDRRLNPSGKSLPNRQKFKNRVREFIRKGVNQKTGAGTIESVMKGGSVSIPIEEVSEPKIHGTGGIMDRVFPGNKKFAEGDILKRPESGGGQGGGKDGGEGDSVDEFQFVLTRDEWADIFLEDCELPDLQKKKMVDTETEGLRHAGFAVSDNPPISVKRTMLNAKSRRIAQGRPTDEEIAELMRQSEECKSDSPEELADRIIALQRKRKRIPYIDTRDIRRKHFEPQKKKNSQAVMFCLMDVSGSMSEHMKDLAKRFYILLYIFLKKRYTRVEIVFVRHTDHAEEVDEKTFFEDPASGGTKVSSAFEAMRDIVKSRYSPSDWNIYVAQASDGDNAYSDNDRTGELVTDEILPICQFFAYIEVGSDTFSFNAQESSLWKLYQSIKAKGEPLAMRKVTERKQIFPVFQELFRKRKPGEVV